MTNSRYPSAIDLILDPPIVLPAALELDGYEDRSYAIAIVPHLDRWMHQSYHLES